MDERDEVGGRVTGERGLREVGIGREEVFGATVEVGEVAAASAGDEDLLARAFGVLEDGSTRVRAAGVDGADESGGTCAEDDRVEGMRGHWLR